MMATDGNLEALRRYEAEQEANEKAFEAFKDEVEKEEIFSRYEDLKEEFFEIVNKYGYDLKFEDFIKENL